MRLCVDSRLIRFVCSCSFRPQQVTSAFSLLQLNRRKLTEVKGRWIFSKMNWFSWEIRTKWTRGICAAWWIWDTEVKDTTKALFIKRQLFGIWWNTVSAVFSDVYSRFACLKASGIDLILCESIWYILNIRTKVIRIIYHHRPRRRHIFKFQLFQLRPRLRCLKTGTKNKPWAFNAEAETGNWVSGAIEVDWFF